MRMWLYSVFAEDVLRKLVALAFAILLWFAVRTQLRDFVVLRNVSVELRDPSGTLFIEKQALAVDITLRGVRKRLKRIKSTDVEVRAQLPKIPDGFYNHFLRLTPDDITVPTGVRVTDIDPPEIRVRLDRIAKKHNVPVRVKFDGTLPKGYRMLRCSPFPSVVDVAGPSRILRDIKEVVTEPVVLNESITQDFEEVLGIVQIPTVRTEKTVHVIIEIAKHSSQKAFRDVPLSILTRAGSSLRPGGVPPRISLTLHGPTVTLDALTDEAIRPFVDVTDITNAGIYRKPVHVWVDQAENVTTEYVHPKTIEIELVAAPPRTTPSPIVPPPPAPDE